MAKIVMIIAPSQFRDEELFETARELERNGHQVSVASRELKLCRGSKGKTTMPDLTIDMINLSQTDALVFVGGGGAQEYFEDMKIRKLVLDVYNAGKIVGAICIAPVILANAGLLKGKKATVFNSEAAHLVEKGAIYTGEPVTQDGRIVTANGPASSVGFGHKISELL